MARGGEHAILQPARQRVQAVIAERVEGECKRHAALGAQSGDPLLEARADGRHPAGERGQLSRRREKARRMQTHAAGMQGRRRRPFEIDDREAEGGRHKLVPLRHLVRRAAEAVRQPRARVACLRLDRFAQQGSCGGVRHDPPFSSRTFGPR